MPIYQLIDAPIFPDPMLANEDGLLAVGGDLSPERLLNAYSYGIFPWFNEGEPILWYALNPRMVLFPNRFKVSKSLRKTVKSNKFQIKFDTQFEEVIEACAVVSRNGQQGTWINSQMKEAYIELHKLGFAHSVETYLNDELVGGLYGVALGKAFFGESMFHKVTDASKVAMYHLIMKLKSWDFQIIDAQQSTAHLKSLGAEEISLTEFLEHLDNAIDEDAHVGKWFL